MLWDYLLNGLLDWRDVDFVVPVSIIVADFGLVFGAEPLIIDYELILISAGRRYGDQQFKLTGSDALHLLLLPV